MLIILDLVEKGYDPDVVAYWFMVFPLLIPALVMLLVVIFSGSRKPLLKKHS